MIFGEVIKKLFYSELTLSVSLEEITFISKNRKDSFKPIVTIDKKSGKVAAVGQEIDTEKESNYENIYFFEKEFNENKYSREELLDSFIRYCFFIIGERSKIFKPVIKIENMEILKENLAGKEKEIFIKGIKNSGYRIIFE